MKMQITVEYIKLDAEPGRHNPRHRVEGYHHCLRWMDIPLSF